MQTHAPFFVLVRCTLLLGLLLMSACDIGEMPGAGGSAASGSRGSGSAPELAYVPGPLQPNSCGTPDTFKACRVASNGPQKPAVVTEERDDRGGAPVSASNGPQKPVVVIEELNDRGGAPGSAINDPFSAYSRSKLEPVLLPSLHQSSDALRREDELQLAIQDMMERRVEALQQQIKRLEQQLSERSEELQYRRQELEQKTNELRALTQTETLRQATDSVRQQPEEADTELLRHLKAKHGPR